VRLEVGEEERDRYDRLLAYVYRADDGRFVNEILVRDGYARPLAIEPNVRHAAAFAALADEALEAGRGLWSACGS
jgi:micrococcal nuclease